MRSLILIALFTALAVVAPAVHAQSGFSGDRYYFTNAAGDGVLTLDARRLPVTSNPVGSAQTLAPFRASLWQNGQTLQGSGVAPTDSALGQTALQLMSFTLPAPNGEAQVYQVLLIAANSLLGAGTYWNASTPEHPIPFSLTTNPLPINAQPELSDGWTAKRFEEAFGGSYQATANGAAGSMAVWTAQHVAPPGGTVELSVFLPRSATPGVLPRTAQAIYHVTPQSYATGRAIPLTPMDSRPVNQAVTSSGWVVVGRFPADEGVAVTLTAATGEPANSHSVVANAIRLRVVGP